MRVLFLVYFFFYLWEVSIQFFFFDPETTWLKEYTLITAVRLRMCNVLQLRSADGSEDDVTGTAAETPLKRACFFFFFGECCTTLDHQPIDRWRFISHLTLNISRQYGTFSVSHERERERESDMAEISDWDTRGHGMLYSVCVVCRSAGALTALKALLRSSLTFSSRSCRASYRAVFSDH